MEKFATYYRDGATGLDYAVNRYYDPGTGRFLTADPSGLNQDLSDPASWNAYAYTEGDPINFNDPDGDVACGDLEILGAGQTLRTAVTANTDLGMLGRLVWAESDHTWSRQGTIPYYQEQDAIAWSVVNRWKVLNGYLSLNGVTNPATLRWGPNGASITQIIGQPGQYSTVVRIGQESVSLRPDLQSTLDDLLGGEPTRGDSVTLDLSSFGLGTVTMTHECFDVWQSWVAASQAISGVSSDPFASKGYTTSFHHGTATTSLEPLFGSFGDANNFFGLLGGQVAVNPTPLLPHPPRRHVPHR